MPSLLYFYNMLPVIGAGDRFTDISIVPHPKGFRKVVEKVLQLLLLLKFLLVLHY